MIPKLKKSDLGSMKAPAVPPKPKMNMKKGCK